MHMRRIAPQRQLNESNSQFQIQNTWIYFHNEASTSFSIQSTIVVQCEVCLGKVRDSSSLKRSKHNSPIIFLCKQVIFGDEFRNLKRWMRKIADLILKYQSRTYINKTREVKDYFQFHFTYQFSAVTNQLQARSIHVSSRNSSSQAYALNERV